MTIKGFNFLRGIAILLVLFRHGDSDNFLQFAGWAGVDLFFVLSGFLVSGLLFKSYQKSGKVDLRNFLIRRGLKIYPSFYLFFIVSILVRYATMQEGYPAHILFSEVFFLQSYLDRMWTHTWSLAVEEHFYLGFSCFMLMLIKLKKISNLKLITGILLFVIITSLLLRFIHAYPHKNDPSFGIFYTHLRADGIAIGVLISYLFYFSDFNSIFLRNKLTTLIVGLLFVSPVFLFAGGSFIMNTIGIFLMNIGFGALVISAFNFDKSSENPVPQLLRFPYRILCFIGVHSYSIYLWHLFVKEYIHFVFPPGILPQFIYLTASLFLGIVLSILFEKPILKWRDRKFKANTSQ